MLTAPRIMPNIMLMKRLNNRRTATSRSRMSAKRAASWIAVLLAFLAVAVFAEDGIVEYVEGDVTVRSPTGVFDVDFGTVVQNGDVIQTGPTGSVVIRLNDRSQVKLRENTELRVDSMGEQARVTLNSGGVFARVARQGAGVARRVLGFEVHTPSVVAGVRGTEFFVAYGRTIEDEPDLWLCVNEGTVEVEVPSTGQSTFVEEGEGTNILAGLRVTDPQPYAWTRDLNWNFDPSAGEIADDTDLDVAYSDLLDQDYD